jgi:hypothetical protein
MRKKARPPSCHKLTAKAFHDRKLTSALLLWATQKLAWHLHGRCALQRPDAFCEEVENNLWGHVCTAFFVVFSGMGEASRQKGTRVQNHSGRCQPVLAFGASLSKALSGNISLGNIRPGQNTCTADLSFPKQHIFCMCQEKMSSKLVFQRVSACGYCWLLSASQWPVTVARNDH